MVFLKIPHTTIQLVFQNQVTIKFRSFNFNKYWRVKKYANKLEIKEMWRQMKDAYGAQMLLENEICK